MSSQENVLLQISKNYKDFDLASSREIDELRSTLYELVHVPTGAQIMHLANEDHENVFCLSFRTLPNSSSGVAHILEHTVLCGSEKYPIKDPFFAMNRRSLNTYMNALTGTDFTCYPAASQVPKDFYNLLGVYVDAVFKPLLKETSFLQEGHRLEFSQPGDPLSELVFKGIVFNEMKGSMASAEARLWKGMMQHLFPDTSYGFNSGGDPKMIPQLKYEELIAFYETYYHPGRCLFYFYGNLPLTQHLDFLRENVFKNVSQVPPLPPIPMQARFTKPASTKISYPIIPGENDGEKTLLAFGWLTCHIKDHQDAMALQVLDLVLMGTDAAPLKHALLRSGLCKQADSYIDTDINELPFVLICKGCRAENAPALSKLLFDTLKKIAKEGIPQKLIEAVIHQLEFSRSEIGGGHYPFGLALFMRSALLKQHGVQPEDGLMIHTIFDALRRWTEDPSYLPSLLQKYLIENPHRVDLILEPDPSLAEKESEQEKNTLAEIRSQLSPDQVKEIIEKTEELAEIQKKQENENVEILPKVTLQDVGKQSRDFALSKETFHTIEVFHHECFTNKIVYADLVFDLPDIPEKELPLLRLFTTLLPELGNGGRDYKSTLEYIQEHTGGIGCSLSLHQQASDFHEFKPTLGLRGKALHRNIEKLFPLMREMITSADFTDAARIKELLDQHHTSLENSLNHNPLKYASNLSASNISIPSRISNYWHGLDYVLAIRKIVAAFNDTPLGLIDFFKSLQQRVLGLQGAHLILSCDDDAFSLIKKEGYFGLDEISCKPFDAWKGDYALAKVQSQGRMISAPVAFTSLTYTSLPYVHPHAPLLNIASHLFENKTLHKRVREQSGAYGAGASSNALAGQFSFYSYRDPHIASTVQAFKESVEKIAQGQFNERDLEDAQLGILQGMDAPVPPGSRGLIPYSWKLSGRTLDIRQAYRDNLLNAKRSDVQQVVAKHLIPQLNQGTLVTFADAALLQKENKLLSMFGEPELPLFSV